MLVKKNDANAINNKTLWKKFKNVIILTEQQRQTNDTAFSSMLKKTRKKKLKFVNVKN